MSLDALLLAAMLQVSTTGIPAVEKSDAPPLPPGTAPALEHGNPLPPMYFVSSIASDDILARIKGNSAFSRLDKELVGSPITLLVTHTVRPSAGGQASGLLTGIISGSTLGLIPIVTSEHLVVQYEVLMQGKTVTRYSFERKLTRATNLWATNDDYSGLGKDGMDWVLSTAADFATKAADDGKLAEMNAEIEYYFPTKAK